MRVVYKEDPRTLAIVSDTHALAFRSLPPPPSREKSAVAVELLPAGQITREHGYRNLLRRDIHGCLGLIEVQGKAYLAVVSRAAAGVARPVGGQSVDRIYGVEFLSLVDNEWDFRDSANAGGNTPGSYNNNSHGNYDPNTDDEMSVHPCDEMRKLLSNGSFYFSNDFDLTSLLQNRGVITSSNNMDDGGDTTFAPSKTSREYMWNAFMMKELFKFRGNLDPYVQTILDTNKIFTTVIRGFAKTIPLNSDDSFTIISKQSWKRAGTRFNARGIDDDGNVANFVETEFIYNHQSMGQVYAFTQIRGSVPAFWEQDTTLLNPKITLTRSIEATQPTFDKHFTDLCTKHGCCHVINLLSKTKPAEVQLSNRYKELYLNSNHREEIDFSDFDFHHETKQLGFVGATKILPMLEQSLEQFGWFVYDSEQHEVITRQDGTFRTNCLDCLDRTNLIQQVISSTVLKHIMQTTNSNSYSFSPEDLLSKHNALWADNGDAISQIYTGTNALKSSFSRSGKMNLAGALSDVTKSVSRMYQNTFVDSKKQSLMDVLLGRDARATPVKIYDPINEYIQEKLRAQSSVYTTTEDITIFVGTFNINAANAMSRPDLTSWLFPPENAGQPLPDIFALGLQEIIELNAGSMLNNDGSKAQQWTKLLDQQLNSNSGDNDDNSSYILLRTESISSMSLLLFVKKSKVHCITQVAGSSKKTGLGGIAANKGGCSVRFEYGATSFCLVTSHLAAGNAALLERFNDYQSIIQGLTFTRNYTIQDHDHILWFGDLNYRIALPNDHCRNLIQHGAFDELSAVDQLNQEIREKGAFYGFKEGAIKFYPTYKFDKGTSDYDSSEKQRVPSWTDRVLYRKGPSSRNNSSRSTLTQLNYNSVMDIMCSDHKPVYSTYRGPVTFVDNSKKKAISRELYYTYKKEHGDEAEVSLVDGDFSSSSSSAASVVSPRSSRSPPAASQNSNRLSFAVDTLSQMNLLDDDLPSVTPRLPQRTNTLPRRVPPPLNNGDSSFRKVTTPNDSNSSTSTSRSTQVPPPPPPPRRTPTAPVGFSSTPLIPSRSNSTTPITTSVPSPVATPAPIEQSKTAPLVPSKPVALVAAKTGAPAVEEKSTRTPPSGPPPPRRNPTATTPTMNMNDWKPLVPK
ncbi:polyphosphatidylinositol phosphatase Inp53p [[Candida] anglica]|uniref:phosphoinositide 5-phosphatase n=1 Tax=[Candida] anglica TaxID=148631 RepID=A0ABP0EDT5_9ASCO